MKTLITYSGANSSAISDFMCWRRSSKISSPLIPNNYCAFM